MKTLGPTFNAIALTLSLAGPAAAEDAPALQTSQTPAVAVMGQGSRNYQTYYMEEGVLSDRTTVRGRAFVDKALGLICEWKETGRRERDANAEFHTVDVRSVKTGCVPASEIPEKWQAARDISPLAGPAFIMQMILNGVDPSDPQQIQQFENTVSGTIGTIQQDTKNLGLLKEVIGGNNPHALPTMRITHTWNLSTNEVCLQTLEVPATETGDVRKAYMHEWGCFPVTNQGYYKRVQETAGIRPS